MYFRLLILLARKLCVVSFPHFSILVISFIPFILYYNSFLPNYGLLIDTYYNSFLLDIASEFSYTSPNL